MSNDPLRDFARTAHLAQRYANDYRVLTGHNGGERFIMRLIRREVMRRVISPVLNNIFRLR